MCTVWVQPTDVQLPWKQSPVVISLYCSVISKGERAEEHRNACCWVISTASWFWKRDLICRSIS